MGAVSERDRRIVLDRAGGMCEVCGAAPASNVHHRRGRGMGGTRRAIHSPAWLLAVCGQGNTSGCHRRIESNRPEAERNGWALPWSVEDARRAPALLWFGRVRLDDEGGYLPAGGIDESGETLTAAERCEFHGAHPGSVRCVHCDHAAGHLDDVTERT